MKPFVMGEITPQPGCRYAFAALPSATMKHAPPHSITSSARATSVGGNSRPSALAVLRFTTKSNFVGCNTGKSPGFSPLRVRAV
jgi:hypothetical protein